MNLQSITYIDSYIKEGNRAILNLKNFYDTILTYDADHPEHIIRIPIGDFFLKYRDQLEEIIDIYHLTDGYFYNPKLLSLDLYGTTELWISLLRLNGYRNITEFRESIIKVYNPARLNELINLFFKREGKIT